MLFMVCVSAFVPFVWVMAVGVGVSGFWWCVFQWCVAVVFASRRVPGVGVCVSWLVPGACSGVVWLVVGACACVVGASVGVCGLVCVLWWFRMLTCSGLFLVFLVLSFVWLITVLWLCGRGWVFACGGLGCVGVFCACFGVGWLCLPLCVGGCVCFVDVRKVCLSASCGLLGCCLCVGLA